MAHSTIAGINRCPWPRPIAQKRLSKPWAERGVVAAGNAVARRMAIIAPACQYAWASGRSCSCFAGCDTRDVLTALPRRKLHDAEPLTLPRSKAVADHRALAVRLWRASQPIADSPATDYLAARGLAPPYPRCLRYNPRTIVWAGEQRRFFPAMIAAVENDPGAVAVQGACADWNDAWRVRRAAQAT